jgi:alpha-beta hydrolase superfamily lysophospholipase
MKATTQSMKRASERRSSVRLLVEIESTRQQRFVWRWDLAVVLAVAVLSYYQSHRPVVRKATPAPTNTTQQLYASQETLKDYNWEWVLVRIDSVTNLPLEALGTDFPDPEVSLHVDAQLPIDIDFSGDLTKFVWPTLWNVPTNITDLKGLGLAAYLQGTATSIQICIKEKNQVDQDYILLNQSLQEFPDVDMEEWTSYWLQQDDIEVTLSMKRMTRPLYTEEDHANMGLTEYLINLENGELASLAYKVKPANRKAVLYFAGRSDSFAHPHLLRMYEDLGYDFYALDVRRSGRARRFLRNPYLGNDVTDFSDLTEDVDLALDYIHAQKEYMETVAHCHSNGALVVISYLLQQRRQHNIKSSSYTHHPEFDGYVLNSPFLAWGFVGGSLNEWVLKNAAMINTYTYPQELWGHPGLNDWWTKIWLLYRWNLAWKPVITNSLTSHYAEAVSQVHQNLLELEGYLLDKPTLVLSSQSDDILNNAEILRLSTHVHPHPTLVEFDLHSHDVTKSLTHDLNDQALHAISEWLEDLQTYHTVH